MFPFSFEWVWDGGHLVFMGGLWYALGIIGMGLTFCVVKSLFDVFNKKESTNHGH